MAENISREVRLYMGKQLKEARERKGFTKEELAGLLLEPDFEESELAGADWKFYFNQE